MKQSMNISVAEAAEILSADSRWVRSACKRNLLGDAYSKNGKRWTVKISDGKLADWLGWSIEQLESTVTEMRERE